MIDLKEKTTGGFNNSRLSYPVNEGRVILGIYLNGSGELAGAPFWSASGFLNESTAQVPAMFRPRPPVTDLLPQTLGVDASSPVEASDRPHGWSMKIGLAPHVVVAFLLVGAAGEGVRLATSTTLLHRAAAPAKAETAAVFSVASSVSIEGSQPRFTAPAQIPLSGGSEWTEAVEKFKRLLAERKAFQASALKQTENDRLLGQLDAWLKATSR